MASPASPAAPDFSAWRGVFGVWLASVAAFAYVTARLYAGSCNAEGRGLEFISSRLAACLDSRPAEVWTFVYVLQFQVLLLLTLWQRVLLAFHFLAGSATMRVLIVSAGVWFIISLASVVEFRNDGTARSQGVSEATLHVYAAAVSLLSFAALHFCIWKSLSALAAFEAGEEAEREAQQRRALLHSHEAVGFRSSFIHISDDAEVWQDYQQSMLRYSLCDCVFFAGVVFFFAAWFVSQAAPGWFHIAAGTEWLVLLAGVLLHGYALRQSSRRLPGAGPVGDYELGPAAVLAAVSKARWRLLSCIASLLYTCSIFVLAPVSLEGDSAGLHSTPMFLVVVLSSYLYAAVLLVPEGARS